MEILQQPQLDAHRAPPEAAFPLPNELWTMASVLDMGIIIDTPDITAPDQGFHDGGIVPLYFRKFVALFGDPISQSVY